jgi:hypothetical protein
MQDEFGDCPGGQCNQFHLRIEFFGLFKQYRPFNPATASFIFISYDPNSQVRDLRRGKKKFLPLSATPAIPRQRTWAIRMKKIRYFDEGPCWPRVEGIGGFFY